MTVEVLCEDAHHESIETKMQRHQAVFHEISRCPRCKYQTSMFVCVPSRDLTERIMNQNHPVCCEDCGLISNAGDWVVKWYPLNEPPTPEEQTLMALAA